MNKRNSKTITYSLSEINQIHNGVTNLMEILDHIDNENVMIKWAITGRNFKTLKKFCHFFLSEFDKKFEYPIEFDNNLFVSIDEESAQMFFVLTMQKPSSQELMDVGKFVYTTAKEKDCNYNGFWLDFIPDDDPRQDY